MDAYCGGWNVHETVSEENKKVLATALSGLVGVTYNPIAVATQIVNGENYLFIAKSTSTTLPPKIGLAKIYISATPAGSTPTLVNIETII